MIFKSGNTASRNLLYFTLSSNDEKEKSNNENE